MSPSSFFATGLALPLLAGAAVVLLYLLRPPPRAVEVPSLLLWRRIAERRRSHERLRRLLSALLSLAVALALALALGGLPRLPRRGEAQLVVVDDTATMATEVSPGTTRLDLARRRARELAAEWPGPTLLADTTGHSSPTWARTEREAARWLGNLVVSPERGRLPPITGIGTETEGAPRRFLVTDGVAIDAPGAWQVESVYAPAINVVWIAFAAETSRRSDAEAAEAYLEVLNASTSAATTRIVIEDADGQTLVDRQLELGARESWSGWLDLPAAGSAVARLDGRLETAGDALAGDDDASISIAERRRISIGTIGVAGALDRALRLLPGVSVRALESEPTVTESAVPGALDLLVASEWAPRDPPPVPALLVNPPSRDWLPEPAETVAAVTVRVREPGRRDWGPVELAGVRRYAPTAGASPLAEPLLSGERDSSDPTSVTSTDDLRLAFAVPQTPAPTFVVGLDLDETAITRHEAFPVLIARMVEDLVAVPSADGPGTAAQQLGRRLSDVNASALPSVPSPSGLAALTERAAPHDGDRPLRRVVLAMLFAALAFSVLETWSRSRGFTE